MKAIWFSAKNHKRRAGQIVLVNAPESNPGAAADGNKKRRLKLQTIPSS